MEDLPGLLLPEGIVDAALAVGQVAENPLGHLLPPGEEHEGGEEAVPAEGGDEPGDPGRGDEALRGGQQEGPEIQKGLAQGGFPGPLSSREGLEEGLVVRQVAGGLRYLFP